MSQVYRQIFKNTSLIGGSAFINILIGMIRTKFIAVLLGPTGIGLMGIYDSLTVTFSTFWGFGLSTSGVRQIAMVKNLNAPLKEAAVIKSLQTALFWLGMLGMFCMLLLSSLLSQWSFGNKDYTLAIAALSLTVLLNSIASGQNSVLQGCRCISVIAQKNTIGPLIATALVIPCYYFWRQNGIVIGMIIYTSVYLAISCYYVRKQKLPSQAIAFGKQFHEICTMLQLGCCLMISGFLTMLCNYIVIVLMVRYLGLSDRGIYQAAMTLSSILIGFVLNAMATDYYPRLSECIHHRAKLYESVNTQIAISILLGLPLLLGICIFSPIAILLLYTAEFAPTQYLIPFFLIGMLGKLFALPLGYIILARGEGRIYLFTEVVQNMLSLGTMYLGIIFYGIWGAAIAFSLSSILYLGQIIVVVFLRYHFVPSRFVWGQMFLGIALLSCGASCLLIKNCWLYYSIGSTFFVIVVIGCFLQLQKKLEINLLRMIKDKLEFIG